LFYLYNTSETSNIENCHSACFQNIFYAFGQFWKLFSVTKCPFVPPSHSIAYFGWPSAQNMATESNTGYLPLLLHNCGITIKTFVQWISFEYIYFKPTIKGVWLSFSQSSFYFWDWNTLPFFKLRCLWFFNYGL